MLSKLSEMLSMTSPEMQGECIDIAKGKYEMPKGFIQTLRKLWQSRK